MKRIILLTILLSIILFINLFLSNKLKYEKSIYRTLITDTNTIIIDFAKQTATGSPLVFGGAHAPNLEHQDAWDLLADAGVTMIRRDFWIENEVPRNITLADYKANKNNVQDPDTWNKTVINETNSIYQNAKDRGMKVMAILSYAPAWLTHSGTNVGVPKDWGVYEDIVKKSYRLHRPYLDMIEIWNEPDLVDFLNIKNSGLSKNEAYLKIFTIASQAIREVDTEMNDGKIIPIIAPAVSEPLDTALLEYLFKSNVSNYLHGVSIHSYNKTEPSWSKYLTVLKKYGKGNLPIYVSEWNKTAEYIINNNYVSSDIAVPYTGNKLIQFLKGGIAGANYFSTTFFDPESPSKYTNSFGFYRQTDNKSELLPQGKTWQLLSRTLSLGSGESRIFDTKQPKGVEAIGFTNSKFERGLAIVNETTVRKTVKVSLRNIKISKNTKAKLFIASGSGDPGTPFCTQDASSNLSDPSFFVDLQPQSVTGIIFTEIKPTFKSLFQRDDSVGDCLVGF